MLMIARDIMANAKAVSLEDIVARQVLAGSQDLCSVEDKCEMSAKDMNARRRASLLQHFYDYAKDNDDEFQTSFSIWLQQNNRSVQ